MESDHIRYLQLKYPQAKEILAKCRGIAVVKNESDSVLHALIRIIIGQMLSRSAAATIYKRVENILVDDPLLKETTAEQLRELGVSTSKSRAILELSAKYLKEPEKFQNWEFLRYEELKEESKHLWGISSWSISILCLFHFGHEDVFPLNDGTIQRSIKRLEEQGISIDPEKASPYRSYLALALWKMIDEKII